MRLITLTTDFGLSDWFAGTMKGVILGIHPEVRLVDLAHGIPSGDIRGGALALLASCRHFPRHTIHVGVVDPGVGSARRPIAVATKDYLFIGPDNGLLSLVLADEEIKSVHQLDNPRFFHQPVSQTFHGRDIFAPVAAHLSKGVTVDKLGPALDNYVQLESATPEVEPGKIRGEVLYIDRFGNAITNITLAHLGDINPEHVKVKIQNRKPFKLGRYYQEVAKGQPLCLLGSTGFLEVSINGGNAAKSLHLNIGHPVEVG